MTLSLENLAYQQFVHSAFKPLPEDDVRLLLAFYVAELLLSRQLISVPICARLQSPSYNEEREGEDTYMRLATILREHGKRQRID